MYMMLNEFLRPIRNAKFERQRTVKMSFDRVSMETEEFVTKSPVGISVTMIKGMSIGQL